VVVKPYASIYSNVECIPPKWNRDVAR
jgi:hypothetical protein